MVHRGAKAGQARRLGQRLECLSYAVQAALNGAHICAPSQAEVAWHTEEGPWDDQQPMLGAKRLCHNAGIEAAAQAREADHASIRCYPVEFWTRGDPGIDERSRGAYVLPGVVAEFLKLIVAVQRKGVCGRDAAAIEYVAQC